MRSTMSHAPFAPCPSCSRHVRVDAAACPFCATDFARADFAPVPDANGRRLGRAALFAFATSVAAVGCTSSQRPDPDPNIVQPYGAPPPPTPPTPDAGTAGDPGLVVAIYGAPIPPADAAAPDAAPDAAAPDAAAPDAAAPDAARPPRPSRPSRPAGPPMVRYGAPPPPDAL
jgi:hypothetical protein